MVGLPPASPPFQDPRYPDLPVDHFVLDLSDSLGRKCASLYVLLSPESELTNILKERIETLDRRATAEEKPMEKKRAKWREENRKRALNAKKERKI